MDNYSDHHGANIIKTENHIRKGKVMTVLEARSKWNISEGKIYDICRALQFQIGRQGYNIPDDMKKPYYPDRRHFAKRDRLHIYIHVLNAIADELMIIPSLIETDEQHVRTAVRELRRTDAIVLLDGAVDDLNYQNYMIGLKYTDWTLHNVKEKMKLVSGMLTIIKGVKDKTTIK